MLDSEGQLICSEVRIENTSKCNAHCIICPREKMTRPKVTMPHGHFINLVEQANRLGAASIGAFGFGEPLLDEGLVDKITYIHNRGLESHITTNASMLTSKLARQLLNAGLSQIRFSIHAVSPKIYSNVHRGLDWFNVTRNICNFVDINKEMGKPCITHMIVIPMHGESVEEIREIWEPLTDYLEIWKPHNWVRGREYRHGKQQKKTCYRPFSGPVQIQADGTVIPCCFLTNSEVVLGNTYEESLKSILSNGNYERLKQAHSVGKLQSYPCGECDQLFIYKNSPLLYSNIDNEMELNRLAFSKYKLRED